MPQSHDTGQEMFWASRRGVLLFLVLYVIVWTIIPLLSNSGLPVDTMEELGWAREWPLGIYRHPPMMIWPLEIIWQASGRWIGSPYLLSGLAFAAGAWFIYELLRTVRPPEQAALAVLMTPLIYFFGPQLPQWNANTAQLPFVGMFLYAVWRAATQRSLAMALLAGVALGGGMLSKYSFAFIPVFALTGLLASRELRLKLSPLHIALSLAVSLIVFSPHLWWLFHAPVTTLDYLEVSAEKTVGASLWGHLFSPAVLLLECAGLLLPAALFARFGTIKAELTADVDPKTDVAFLKFLGFSTMGPLLLTAAIGAYGGGMVKDQWLIAFMLAPPAFVVVFLLKSSARARLKPSAAYLYAFMLLVLAAAYPAEREWHYWRSGEGPEAWAPLMPIEPLRDMALQTWHDAQQRAGLPSAPPAIIAGSGEAAGIAATLIPRAAWLERFDNRLAPWVTDDDIRTYGLVATEDVPEGFDTRYGLCIAEKLDYTWLNGRGRMGRPLTLTVLLPESACKNR